MLNDLTAKLIIVSGKGGVGKTTVASALAYAFRTKGERVLLCEIGSPSRLPLLWSSAPLASKPSLLLQREGALPPIQGIHLLPKACMEEYLELKIRIKPLVHTFAKLKAFEALLSVAPGLNDLVTSGKIYQEALQEGDSPYDRVIVDAPSTGHGIGFLMSPKNYRDLFPFGPIHEDAKRMLSVFQDPSQTQTVLVALPEEMPVTETLEFKATLESELQMAVPLIVINRIPKLPLEFSKANGLQNSLDAASQLDPKDTEALLQAFQYFSLQVQKSFSKILKLKELSNTLCVGLPEIHALHKQGVPFIAQLTEDFLRGSEFLKEELLSYEVFQRAFESQKNVFTGISKP